MNRNALKGWTPAEVTKLAQAFPEAVERIGGQVVPSVSREEFNRLAELYPSHLRDDAAPAKTLAPDAGETATLRARYPSMFGGGAK